MLAQVYGGTAKVFRCGMTSHRSFLTLRQPSAVLFDRFVRSPTRYEVVIEKLADSDRFVKIMLQFCSRDDRERVS